jgi:hypothetical protein
MNITPATQLCHFCNQDPGIHICIDCNICENLWCAKCLESDIHAIGAKYRNHRLPFIKDPIILYASPEHPTCSLAQTPFLNPSIQNNRKSPAHLPPP